MAIDKLKLNEVISRDQKSVLRDLVLMVAEMEQALLAQQQKLVQLMHNMDYMAVELAKAGIIKLAEEQNATGTTEQSDQRPAQQGNRSERRKAASKRARGSKSET